MLRRVYQGFLYRHDAFHIHPIVGLLILFLQFLLLIGNNIMILMIILSVILVENVISSNFQGIFSLLRAILPLLLILGGFTFLFGGPTQASLIIFRLLIGTFSCSFFFAVTNPSDLTRVLEKIKVPTKWAIIPSLALTMVPRVAKDAEETFQTLALRGEIGGFFIKWLPKALAIFVASVLYRSEFLAQSLYSKGVGIQQRTHYRSVPFQKGDIIRLVSWLVICILIIAI